MSALSTRAPSPTARLPRDRVLLPLVGLLATLVSLTGAWRPSLWTDEAATVSAAGRDPADLWRLLQHLDAVHGLYYAAAHVWTAVAGTSALALRAPSAVAVGVATVGVLVLARRLAGPGPGPLLAAAAFALLPRVTWTGTEARSSAAATAFAVWATVLLARALDRRRTGAWIAYTACAATGCVLNIYLLLLLLAHGTTLALRRGTPRRDRLAWLTSAAAAALVTAPVVLLARRQSGQLGDAHLGPVELAVRVVVNQFFLGETPTVVGAPARGVDWWRPAAVALAVLGWALVAVALARAARGSSGARRTALWTLPWLVLPTVVVAGYSLVAAPLHNPRYFAFCTPALALLLGSGLTALGRRPRVVVAALAVLLVAPVLTSQRQPDAKSGADWAQVAQYLCRNASPGQAVYFGARRAPVDGVVTLTTRAISVAYPRCFTGLDDVTLLASATEAGDLTGRSRPLGASLDRLAGHDTVWVVRRPGDATVAADDAVLAAAGFARGRQWTGTLDEVVEFTRR
ncbi:glycosyltransferase family 39 protein [Kineococcus sp. SYSU DK001]|uniref:glycosyltransferase family 39 protein n=1 Tax=Kineococcus sp. SYSU DK001 TaxID=3383122 RepID=UPI003D7C823C